MHSSIEVGQKEEPSVLGILHCTPVEVRTYQEGSLFWEVLIQCPRLVDGVGSWESKSSRRSTQRKKVLGKNSKLILKYL